MAIHNRQHVFFYECPKTNYFGHCAPVSLGSEFQNKITLTDHLVTQNPLENQGHTKSKN